MTVTSGLAAMTTSTFPVTYAIADIVGEPPPLTTARATNRFVLPVDSREHAACCPAEASADAGPARAQLATSGIYLWSTSAAPGDSVHLVVYRDAGESTDLLVGGDIRANGSGVGGWQTSGYAPRPAFSLANFTNRLYRNEGDGTFTEVTSTAFAVNDSTVSSLGAAWGDYDCDGWVDVYITNSGNVETGNVPNQLHRNNGDGTFTEVAAAEGVLGSDRGLGDGAAWGDVNGDGFLDLFVDNGAEHPPFGVGPRELFENTPNSNHWIQLNVHGLASNGSGIGARLRFVTGSGIRWRTVQGESDNCFSNSRTVHVGLGADDHADTLQVFWPSGQVDTFGSGVLGDNTYWLIEGKPLRLNQNPHFIALTSSVSATLSEGATKNWNITVDNFGGKAVDFSASYEDCTGAPISWLSIDPEVGGLWPGEQGPFVATADASGLAGGLHCGRIVFDTNSFLGPDTVMVSITVTDSPVGVDLPSFGIPSELSLGSPRPNPTAGASRIALGMPQEGRLDAAVYDVSGRRVAVLESGIRPAGWHTLEWSGRGQNGRPVAAGLYLIRAHTAGESAVRKVIVRE
ncbi:MAG: hypothetical protein DHS20C21_19120 [Gemmatimonadota bacterium]|nr:MAG: hypothetical protein DHS20C21_19120 [Gemmatimonadota bacterium]